MFKLGLRDLTKRMRCIFVCCGSTVLFENSKIDTFENVYGKSKEGLNIKCCKRCKLFITTKII